MYVEILPSIICDIVCKSFEDVPDGCRLENNTSGYKPLNNAIIESQDVGFRLLRYVKPENLLFIFSEAVQSLQSSLREFADERSVVYPASDCYGPIYKEQYARDNKCDSEPYAIVLCKLGNSESIEPLLGSKQEKGRDDAKRYEITWRELQNLQCSLGVIGAHKGRSPNI